MRTSPVIVLLAAVLFAGQASAQLIRRQANEKEAAQYIYGAFLTQAAEGIVSERIVVAPEVQRRLGLPPGADRARTYQALVSLTDNKGFSVRKSTPEELASYVSGRFETGLTLPVYTLQVEDIKLLVQYDLVRHHIPFVGELGAPGTEPQRVVAAAATVRKPAAPNVVTELFEFNKAALTPAARAELDRDLLPKVVQGTRVRITGHSDRLGSAQHNRKLAEQRAESVRAYLVSRGVDAGAIEIAAAGASAPVTDCAEVKKEALIECLAPNRRVEIELR